MTKYLKITDFTADLPATGYHDVNDDFELPPTDKHSRFEFVTETEARLAHPALFGARPTRKQEK